MSWRSDLSLCFYDCLFFFFCSRDTKLDTWCYNSMMGGLSTNDDLIKTRWLYVGRLGLCFMSSLIKSYRLGIAALMLRWRLQGLQMSRSCSILSTSESWGTNDPPYVSSSSSGHSRSRTTQHAKGKKHQAQHIRLSCFFTVSIARSQNGYTTALSR